MLSTRYWIFLLIIAAAIGYSMLKFSKTATHIITSPADPYGYKYMELENKLKVLLVQTPGIDKASAALSVDVGSMDDPEGREGLAHFLEHMLFLGTEPYPEADEYQQFIKQNGGSHNAFTSYKQTTYFFDVDKDQLTGALDRFAPFFISPTFDANYVDREKNAVNAEFKAKYMEDSRRIFSAEKMALNPDFGYSQFSTGNLDTLSDQADSSIRDELIEFYQTHYSSDRMSLVITGDYPLDELANMARTHFSKVPQLVHDFERPDVPMFMPDQLPIDMNIQPVKEIRRLQLTFPLPESISQYQYKPISFLANLLGHEGEGSVLALLKEKGWAESLSAGKGITTEHASTLVVSIGLTRNGLAHKEEVTRVLMSYIELLQKNPLPEYLKKEEQQLSDMAFRYQEHGRISQYAIRLSSNMLTLPTQDIVYGSYRNDEASDELINRYLSQLTPENMLRTLIAPDVETDTTDPWYGTEVMISASQYDNSIEVEGLDQLHLPAPNPFIPEDFSLRPDPEQSIPSVLLNKPERQVWYYPEHEFKLPKTQIITSIFLPGLSQDPQAQLYASLYSRAINEALNTYSYPAYLAGLSYRLDVNDQGLQVLVSGYQDKIPELLNRIFVEMKQVNMTPEEFTRYKASLKRSLENNLKARPYQRAISELKHQIITPSFSDTELLEVIDPITLEDVSQFAQQINEQVASLTYIHGAIDHQEALKLADIVEKYFPANHAIPGQAELVRLPAGKYQQQMIQEHQDKVFTLYIQGKERSDKARAEMGLLAQMMSSPYYNYMRTEQQLGYIVFAAAYPQMGIPGLILIVQSPEASPQEILDHSQVFFSGYESRLSSMSDEEFELFKEGLITKLLEKPKNIAEKSRRFWGDLQQGRTSFDTQQAIATQVKDVTKESVINLYNKAILAPEFAWLLIEKGEAVEGFLSTDELSSNSDTFTALQPGAQLDNQGE